ncbi:hypothetical protein Dsin_001879 [Dipteronia sinensis]|uniref:Uncharacterized protein n=1 Tax=Dipteronia sinensis TaxID=43782 RepID=A0AAE0B5L3_9ROSI|nr:hypothetical protein Dsin_001879 [Dipteronia sinensis]
MMECALFDFECFVQFRLGSPAVYKYNEVVSSSVGGAAPVIFITNLFKEDAGSGGCNPYGDQSSESGKMETRRWVSIAEETGSPLPKKLGHHEIQMDLDLEIHLH